MKWDGRGRKRPVNVLSDRWGVRAEGICRNWVVGITGSPQLISLLWAMRSFGVYATGSSRTKHSRTIGWGLFDDRDHSAEVIDRGRGQDSDSGRVRTGGTWGGRGARGWSFITRENFHIQLCGCDLTKIKVGDGGMAWKDKPRWFQFYFLLGKNLQMFTL